MTGDFSGDGLDVGPGSPQPPNEGRRYRDEVKQAQSEAFAALTALLTDDDKDLRIRAAGTILSYNRSTARAVADLGLRAQ